jgi:hypothetical protein
MRLPKITALLLALRMPVAAPAKKKDKEGPAKEEDASRLEAGTFKGLGDELRLWIGSTTC